MSKKVVTKYRVVDNFFNQTWYNRLIGKVCDTPPGYANVEEVRVEMNVPETVGELTQELINHCNKMGHEPEIVADILNTLDVSHRTLQACFFRVMQNVICEYANRQHDLRNEAAVEWCRKVKNIEHYIPFI